MNKARVEAFTDAVVAIIMTIMVLEFKTPTSPRWTAILVDMPYLFAFIVSFVFVGVAWYNHHYMFVLAERISKRVYWWNNAWLFTMALIPVATAWAGRFLAERGPEFFYWFVFFLWSVAYLRLSEAIKTDLQPVAPAKAARIAQMTPYRFMASWRFPVAFGLTALVVFVWPPSCLVLTLVELVYMALHTNDDSDRVAQS